MWILILGYDCEDWKNGKRRVHDCGEKIEKLGYKGH